MNTDMAAFFPDYCCGEPLAGSTSSTYDASDGARATGLRSGAELYAEPSITGLSSQPVDDHQAFALLGASPSAAPPVDIEELALRLLHSGSVALVRREHLDGGTGFGLLDGLILGSTQQSFSGGGILPPCNGPTQDGGGTPPPQRCFLVPFTEHSFTQRFNGEIAGEPHVIHRTFAKGGDGWTVRDFAQERRQDAAATNGFSDDADWKQIGQARLPADSVVAYPNGVGILYRAQRGYRRLERIFSTVERLQSGVNAKTIIAGYIGNADQAHSELARGDRDVALFPTGASVHRVASTAAIDQLMREFDTLLPLYLRRLHIIVPSGDERLSGVSRRLAMAPMLAFVERTRRNIAAVLGQLGVDIGFERIRLESMEESAQKYALLKLMRDDGVLEAPQFRNAAMGLLA